MIPDPKTNSAREQEIIEQILDRYEWAMAHGQDFSLAVACKNWPHLIPQLETQLAALKKIDEQLEAISTADADFRKYLQPTTRLGWLGRLGHYEIEEILGCGGFGIVAKAFDEKLHRVVAIKIMRPELAATSPPRKRFVREARVAAAITHQNIIAIHAVEDQPLPFLVMEYISGRTVQELMNENGPLEAAEVLLIGQQIAAGLAAAHAVQLIHRDIKPANILLTGSPIKRVKISDFGLARAADDASITASGLIAGTPMYMSPEQARGETLDHRSDLFSLGSVLYVMASGRPPFRAANTVAVLKRVCDDHPRSLQDVLPGTPDWLETIIFKLLEKNRRDRYQTAQEVAELLARCRSQLDHNGRVTCIENRVAVEDTADTAVIQPASATSRGSSPMKRSFAWLLGGSAIIGILYGLLMMNDGTLFDNQKNNAVHQGKQPNRSGAMETTASQTALANNSPKIIGDRELFERLQTLGAEIAAWGLESQMTAPLRRAMKDMGNDNWTLIDSTNLNESPGLMREPNLFLSFRGESFDDAHLAEVVRLMNLRPSDSPALNIQLIATSVTSEGIKALSKIHVNTLGLSDFHLDQVAVNSIADNKPSGTLIIANGGLSDSDLEQIVANSRFVWLHIPNNQITQKSLSSIAQSKVVILNVADNNLSDEDLAVLSKFAKLTGLYLTGNPVSDVGLKHLHLMQLTNLFLERTNVTKDGIARLHRELPNCRITWDGGTVAPGTTLTWPADADGDRPKLPHQWPNDGPPPAIAPFTAEEAKQH